MMYESVKMLTNDRVRMLFTNSTPELVRRTTSKCLFGVPDPVETNKLYEEQMMMSRLNCIKRWNFDVYTSQPAGQPNGLHWVTDDVDLNESDEETTRDDGEYDDCCHGRKLHPRGTEIRTGRVTRPGHHQKQIKLTEIWQIKKKSSSSQATKQNDDDL